MRRQEIWVWAAVAATLVLFGVCSFVPLYGMWGINHLAFLGSGWRWGAGLVCLAVLILAGLPSGSSRRQTSAATVIDDLLARWWVRAAVSLVASVLFRILRLHIFFLGDGYTLISTYGVEGSFIRQWPEPGSALVLEIVQKILGGESREAFRTAAQLLSVVSGGVTVFALATIPRFIAREATSRAILTATILFSGVLLLFFGYVEYYPMLWAAGSLFLLAALRYLASGRGIAFVIMLFGVTCVMHLQAVVLLPGMLILLLHRFRPQMMADLAARVLRVRYVVAAGIGLSAAAYAMSVMAVPGVTLPLTAEASATTGYALLSGIHLSDILNELLVMYPGCLVLIAAILGSVAPARRDVRVLFLAASALGAAAFVFVVDPVLGMGRDWDLMSFLILPAMLALWAVYGSRFETRRWRQVAAYALVCLLLSATYVAANRNRMAGERRFVSLLKLYDKKDESGWAVLVYYYLNENRKPEAQSLASEMLARDIRPAETHHVLGVLARQERRYSEAVGHLSVAVERRPSQARWLNELGQVYIEMGDYERAKEVLRRARSADPQLLVVLESEGLVYIRSGDTAAAAAVADTLVACPQGRAGGSLIRLVLAYGAGKSDLARQYLDDFVQYGRGRSDYDRIIQYYSTRVF